MPTPPAIRIRLDKVTISPVLIENTSLTSFPDDSDSSIEMLFDFQHTTTTLTQLKFKINILSLLNGEQLSFSCVSIFSIEHNIPRFLSNLQDGANLSQLSHLAKTSIDHARSSCHLASKGTTFANFLLSYKSEHDVYAMMRNLLSSSRN